jgi:prolipoprotein diacylglyceryltransferase
VPAVYPTPLYELAMTLVIFAILWSLRKRWKIPGTIFALYVLLNGVERFLIEKIRVNVKFDVMGIQMTQAEIIAILFILSGAAMLFWLHKKSRTSGTA